MEIDEFLNAIGRKKKAMISIVVLFLAVSTVLTFSQPLQYQAKSKLFIVQDFNGQIDPYTAAKTNEYLSNVLASIVASESFFRDVMNSDFKIDKTYFPSDAKKKMKLWRNTVSAKAVNDTGIIALSVMHPDRYQLEQIARAVDYILNTSIITLAPIESGRSFSLSLQNV